MKKLICKWFGHKKGWVATTGMHDFALFMTLGTQPENRQYYCKRCDIDLLNNN